MPADRWTKADTRALCGFLHSFYVVSRPLDFRDYDAVLPRIREAIATRRKDIILAGIRAAMTRTAERYRSDCATIGNQLVRFTEYGKPDELITRFISSARDADRARKKLEELLHRVLDEPLPVDVETYDPIETMP